MTGETSSGGGWFGERLRRRRGGGPWRSGGDYGLLQPLPVAVVVVDHNEDAVTVNEAAERMRLLRGTRVASTELRRIIRDVRRDGVSRQADLELSGSGPLATLPVRARVSAAGGEDVLVVVEDLSELRRADQTRRDVVANLSHELKTPVGALRVLAEALGQATGDPAAVVNFAGRIEKEAARLGELIEQMLSLARLEHHGPARHEVVSVEDVVRQSVDWVAPAAADRGVRITLALPGKLRVAGRSAELVMALRNLLDNAVTYSPPGVPVTVEAAGEGDRVRISVIDQGPGIPPEDRERIFERFYRSDPARARTSGGSGLGLAIAKHVAIGHGGEITVDSRIGAGSRFSLLLPAAPAQVELESARGR
jgi:two-component system sensor histidine kinase SenX3